MLGDILRREREKQGLTIKDIENETSIRSLYIEAIEKGDYDHLPSDVYTKGFIR
ncbi:MAG: helix-turn-helix domain-containing protein, partial [Anaerovibrio sp.]